MQPANTPSPSSPWRIAPDRLIDLTAPKLMGILNITPDSFADGGRHLDPAHAINAGLAMIAEGATFLDVGGESTRPGSQPVPADKQLRRVLPVIRGLASHLPPHVAISIDTTSATVAAAGLDAGASIINDVSAGRDDPAMLSLAAHRRCGLILMHRERHPAADRFSDRYDPHQPAPMQGDVVASVRAFLEERANAAIRAGVSPDAIVLDPGLGFGKTVDQNLALISGTPQLASLGFAILSGLSRKSFVGRIGLSRDSTPDERLPATLALSLRHAQLGASILRVHDIAPHAQAFRAFSAIP